MLTARQRTKTLTTLTLAVFAGTLLLQSHPAFAQVSLSGNSNGSIGFGIGGGALFSSGTNFLTALMTLLTTTWARLIAIIAIVIVGVSFMFGRISMHIAAAVIGGIILVFGAPAIVDGISASL
jgi:type IV secretory pathway VirB2 component (pilin)